METQPVPKVHRLKHFFLRLEVVCVDGCIVAPIGIARFLIKKMQDKKESDKQKEESP